MIQDLVAVLRRLLAVLTVGTVFTLCGGKAFAQPPAGGTLRVTVVDPSGAVVVGATVSVIGADETTKGAPRLDVDALIRIGAVRGRPGLVHSVTHLAPAKARVGTKV